MWGEKYSLAHALKIMLAATNFICPCTILTRPNTLILMSPRGIFTVVLAEAMLDRTAFSKLWGELLSTAQKRVTAADSALLHVRFMENFQFLGEFGACENRA